MPRGFLMFLVMCLSNPSAAVELYRWKDKQGNTHFSDTPPAQKDVEVLNIQVKTYTGPAQVTQNSLSSKADASIRVYVTDWCGVCKSAKQYMDDKSINYQEFDIEKSTRAMREYKRLGGKGVPLILVGRQKMSGFNPARFQRMIEQANSNQ